MIYRLAPFQIGDGRAKRVNSYSTKKPLRGAVEKWWKDG